MKPMKLWMMKGPGARGGLFVWTCGSTRRDCWDYFSRIYKSQDETDGSFRSDRKLSGYRPVRVYVTTSSPCDKEEE